MTICKLYHLLHGECKTFILVRAIIHIDIPSISLFPINEIVHKLHRHIDSRETQKLAKTNMHNQFAKYAVLKKIEIKCSDSFSCEKICCLEVMYSNEILTIQWLL